MAIELSSHAIAERLAELRVRYTAMTAAEARARLESTTRVESFEAGVARRLAELRALIDLTNHLHRARMRR